MKKMGIGLLLLFVVFGLAGCGEKKEATTESSAAKQDNPLEGLSEKDVVSEEETEVDGETIVIKTLKDGQTIALPKGMTIDDAKKEQENGNGELSVHEEETSKDPEK